MFNKFIDLSTTHLALVFCWLWSGSGCVFQFEQADLKEIPAYETCRRVFLLITNTFVVE